MIWSLTFVLAASMGAFLRYRADLALSFGSGVLFVNILGGLLIGFLFVFLDRFSPQLKVVILVGFLGSLTTFSSYSLHIVKLFENGDFSKALSYCLLSNVLSISACYLGYRAAHLLPVSS